MILDEFRDEMNGFWELVRREADEMKDPYVILERLLQLYARFDADERELANTVIGEWTLGADDGKRYDALAMIDELKILSALPALHQLSRRLAESSALGAAEERAKVERIIDGLLSVAANGTDPPPAA